MRYDFGLARQLWRAELRNLNHFDWRCVLLKLKADQIARLGDERADAFARQLAVRAQARHPKAVAPLAPDDLTACLRLEIDAARANGLKSRGDMERWSDLACILGFGFADAQPWAVRLLAADRPPAQKLGMLEETAAFAARES